MKKKAKICMAFLMIAAMIATMIPSSLSFAEETDYTTEAVIECLSEQTSVTANNIKSDGSICTAMYYVSGNTATISDGQITIPFYDVYSMEKMTIGGVVVYEPETAPACKTVSDVTFKLTDLSTVTFEKVTVGSDVYYCTSLVLNGKNSSGVDKEYTSRIGFELDEDSINEKIETIKTQKAITDAAVEKITSLHSNSNIAAAFLKTDGSAKAKMMIPTDNQVFYDGTNLVLNVTISGDHQMLAAVCAGKTYTADENGQVTIPVADLYDGVWSETTVESCQYAVRLDVQYSNPSSGEAYGTFARLLAFDFNNVVPVISDTTAAVLKYLNAQTSVTANNIKSDGSICTAMYYVSGGTATISNGQITIPFYDVYSLEKMSIGGVVVFEPETAPACKTVSDVTFNISDLSYSEFEKVVVGEDTYYCTSLVLNGKNSSGVDKEYTSRIGFKVEENYIDTASIAVGSSLGLTVTSVVSDLISAPKMQFTMNETKTIVNGTKNDDGTWSFKYNFIYANNMSDTVKMEILDGETVVASKDYSVKNYCDALYNSTATQLSISADKKAKLDIFIADMLEYGAMTQIYTNHNTSDLSNDLTWVSDTKTATFEKPESDKSIIISTTDSDNKIVAAAMHLDESIETVFYVKANTADTLRISDGSLTTDYKLSNYSKTNGYYEISAEKLAASKLDTTYTVSLMTSGEIVNQITYGVNSYIASKCNDTDTKLANLVKAIYNYGVSAKGYEKA